jgi:hypothetical protein
LCTHALTTASHDRCCPTIASEMVLVGKTLRVACLGQDDTGRNHSYPPQVEQFWRELINLLGHLLLEPREKEQGP